MENYETFDQAFEGVLEEISYKAGSPITNIQIVGETETSVQFLARFKNGGILGGSINIYDIGGKYAMRCTGNFL